MPPPLEAHHLWPLDGIFWRPRRTTFSITGICLFFPKNDAIISDNFLPRNAPKLIYSEFKDFKNFPWRKSEKPQTPVLVIL